MVQDGEVIYDDEPKQDNTTRNIIIVVVVLLILLCCCCSCLSTFGLFSSGILEEIMYELEYSKLVPAALSALV